MWQVSIDKFQDTYITYVKKPDDFTWQAKSVTCQTYALLKNSLKCVSGGMEKSVHKNVRNMKVLHQNVLCVIDALLDKQVMLTYIRIVSCCNIPLLISFLWYYQSEVGFSRAGRLAIPWARSEQIVSTKFHLSYTEKSLRLGELWMTLHSDKN